jgi:hypothetical protein
VDPRAHLDDVEKRKFLTLPGLQLQPFGRPARSQSLYRLRYPDSYQRNYPLRIRSSNSPVKRSSLTPPLAKEETPLVNTYMSRREKISWSRVADGLETKKYYQQQFKRPTDLSDLGSDVHTRCMLPATCWFPARLILRF